MSSPSRLLSSLAAFAIATMALTVHGKERDAEADEAAIDTIDIQGNGRTRRGPLLELLPRPPPAIYTHRELEEFERRLNNLEIFDAVTVERSEGRLTVKVREKWTLIPALEFSTGKTAEDARVLVGATEYNFLGTANQLTLNLFREERGFGTKVAFQEHVFRRQRWTFGAEAVGATAAYRFESGSSWNAFRTGGELGFTSPPVVSQHLNVRVGGYYFYEATSDRVRVSVPANAHAMGPFLSLLYNRYEFHDLVSSGVKAELELTSGLLASTAPLQPRHGLELKVIGALPLAKYTVLTTRAVVAVASRGNANYSFLIGSIEGVRGLDDTLYRTWTQGYVNLELRQGLPLFERWALQRVVFGDAGAGASNASRRTVGAGRAALRRPWARAFASSRHGSRRSSSAWTSRTCLPLPSDRSSSWGSPSTSELLSQLAAAGRPENRGHENVSRISTETRTCTPGLASSIRRPAWSPHGAASPRPGGYVHERPASSEPTESSARMQIFPRSLNKLPLIIGGVGAVAPAVLIGAIWYYLTPKNFQVGYAPAQPVPYSHRLHAGQMGMDCRYCHANVEVAAKAMIPPTQTCMGCHAMVKTDSARLAPVRASWESGKPVEWVQVHKLPDHAYFDHSAHLAAGVGCATCHGRVDEMDVVRAETPLSMGWCLECHRDPKPNLRPKDQITNMQWKPEMSPGFSPPDVNPPQHCSGCHR